MEKNVVLTEAESKVLNILAESKKRALLEYDTAISVFITILGKLYNFPEEAQLQIKQNQLSNFILSEKEQTKE